MRLLELVRPYRMIVTRRVTEEEQVSVEAFHRTQDGAQADLERFLGVFRDHRKATNQEVVRATQQQLAALDTAIQAKGNEAQRLDLELEEKRIKVANLDLALKQRNNKLGRQAVVDIGQGNGTLIQTSDGLTIGKA